MFFKKSKIELFMLSFGAHLPFTPKQLQEQNIYPLSLRTEAGFDLDYNCLLLVDRLIIDKHAYDFINSSERPHLRQMKATVERLMDAGRIKLIDYQEIAVKMRTEIIQRVNMLVEVPQFWLSTARRHWQIYRPEIPDLIKRYGTNADQDIEKLHFGVYCHLKNTSDRMDYVESARLHKLLETRKTKLSHDETSNLREIVKPLVAQIIFNNLLRIKLGCPFIDWQDLRPYYEKIDATVCKSIDNNNDQAVLTTKCRELFRIALPELKPASIDEVLKFIKKRSSVRSLKRQLRESIESGEQLDEQWGVRLRNDANRAQLVARHRHRTISIIGALVGLPLGAIPVDLGVIHKAVEVIHNTIGSEVIHVAGEIGKEITKETAGETSDNLQLKKFLWYYTLLDTKQK